MGWKCTDCGDRGPELEIRWCPNCGSTSWQPTDADGLTAGEPRHSIVTLPGTPRARPSAPMRRSVPSSFLSAEPDRSIRRRTG